MFLSDVHLGKTHMERKAESKVIVAVRVRPLSDDEQERNEESIVYCPDEHTLLVSQEGLVEKAFSFNMVFSPESSQQEIFDTAGMRRLIEMAIEGYSCTVFAFGQTGSGKTYTITGPHSLFSEDSEERELEGLMQRSVAYLLEQVHSSDEAYQLCASYSEVYNEQVRDLLNPWLTYSLAVRGSKTSGFYVENLSVVEFCNLEGFMTLLESGMQNRQTSCQTQNEHSSRSHSILTLYIKHTSTGVEPAVVTQGKLCVVDLAGSERVKDGDSTEKLLEETGNINRSLLTLGKCITALVDPKKRNGHIPYRDSKLTMLLSDSLGGKGITLMIACVSPTADNLQETMNTLRYSSKAKRIKNKPVAKSDLREQILANLQKEIRTLKEENMILRQHLPKYQAELESEASVRNTGSTDGITEPIGSSVRSDFGSEASLGSLLQDLMKEIDKLQRDKRVLLDKQESSDQQRERLSQENIRLIRKLQDLERVICSSPHSSSSYSGMSLGDEGSSDSSLQWNQNPIQPLSHLPPEQSPSYPHYPIMYCCTCSLESHQQGQACSKLFERLALHEESYGVHYHTNPQVRKLPPIQDTDAASHLGGEEGGGQTGLEVPGEEPVSEACLPLRRRSQVEKRGYAERFQDLLEARAQKAQSAEVTTIRPQQGASGLPLLANKRGDSS